MRRRRLSPQPSGSLRTACPSSRPPVRGRAPSRHYPVPHHPRGLRRSGPLPKRRCLPVRGLKWLRNKENLGSDERRSDWTGAGPAAGTFGGGRLGNGAGAGENRGREPRGPKDLSPAARSGSFLSPRCRLGPRASGLGPRPAAGLQFAPPAAGSRAQACEAPGGAAVDAALSCEASDKMALQGWLSPNTTALPGTNSEVTALPREPI